MNENIVFILATIGSLCVIGIAGSLLVLMIQSFCEFVGKFKYKYRYKHRFDKPPTAECFCRDCVRHDNETEKCYKFDWYTGDNWFCWDAEPREHKFEK